MVYYCYTNIKQFIPFIPGLLDEKIISSYNQVIISKQGYRML